jgi:methylated-DNA-[protein]-cysteine S-methyltransferase
MMTTIESPLGTIHLVADEHALIGAYLPAQEKPDAARGTSPILEQAARELCEYFRGERRTFEVPVRGDGTDFQRAVWGALREIPFGQTRTYGELATELDRGSPRAVGSANAKNPISIFVPCHRVIGKDGALVGYAGGEAAKRWLLAHEKR